MRIYKDRAALSLNPILDILFLQTNYDNTPFPSLKSRHNRIKTSSLKDLHKYQNTQFFKSKEKDQIVAGFRMTIGSNEVRKRSSSSLKKRFIIDDPQDVKYQVTLPNKLRQSPHKKCKLPTECRVEKGKNQKTAVNKLRQNINLELQNIQCRKSKNQFNILINSYRQFS